MHRSNFCALQGYEKQAKAISQGMERMNDLVNIHLAGMRDDMDAHFTKLEELLGSLVERLAPRKEN